MAATLIKGTAIPAIIIITSCGQILAGLKLEGMNLKKRIFDTISQQSKAIMI